VLCIVYQEGQKSFDLMGRAIEDKLNTISLRAKTCVNYGKEFSNHCAIDQIMELKSTLPSLIVAGSVVAMSASMDYCAITFSKNCAWQMLSIRVEYNWEQIKSPT
jgi:hypothetical protein